jgi:hypothetical protein
MMSLAFGLGPSTGKKGKGRPLASLLNVMREQYRGVSRPTHGTYEEYAPYYGLEGAGSGLLTVEQMNAEKAPKHPQPSRANYPVPGKVPQGVWQRLSIKRPKKP